MSTQRKPEFIEDDISEHAVHDYLEANLDFFERHSELLSSLRLPHISGDTVSLVERQISILRQKDRKLECNLEELIEVARINDSLGAKLHQLMLGLLAAKGISETLEEIETVLRTEFNTDISILVLFNDPPEFKNSKIDRFFKPIERNAKSLKAFATFLKGSTPSCGQIRNIQKDFLFGKEMDEIRSVALVPLGKKSEIGFLAIGSRKKNHFHPDMSIDLLLRLGDLIAGALKRF
jgi:uncharacterized protein YigA (DUF484 family)